MDVQMKFGEAVKKLDLEADTFFIVHFDSKDPDDMTTVVQGDVVKLAAAVGMQFGSLKDDALMALAKASLSHADFEVLETELKQNTH